jgi:uncharacterized protein
MKRSRYNKVVHVLEGDRHLLFNGITTALISLDGELFEKVEDILAAINDGFSVPEDDQTQEIYRTLVDGRFIIPRPVDELALLKVRYNVSRHSNPLSLTILPTLACNLACVYCYENSRPDSMTEDTVDAVCAYVEERARNERINRFHVTWYGGEPLLAASTVWELSERFLSLSEEHGFKYTAAITTNGTLLTKEAVDNLLLYNVKNMQVTVDGPRDTHDGRRPFKSGKGSSFDAIMHNLDYVVGKMSVMLRTNTDNRNVGGAIELLDVFAEKGWLDRGKKFRPYMAPVSKMTEACADTASDCCTAQDFVDHSMDFCRACVNHGVAIKTRAEYHFPITVKYNCGAIALNSMVVNPSGDIHKCGLTVSDDTENLGNIRDPMDLVNPNMLKWLSFDPFELEECRECDLFPVCLGACPRITLAGENPAESNSCKYLKDNIETILILHGT